MKSSHSHQEWSDTRWNGDWNRAKSEYQREASKRKNWWAIWPSEFSKRVVSTQLFHSPLPFSRGKYPDTSFPWKGFGWFQKGQSSSWQSQSRSASKTTDKISHRYGLTSIAVELINKIPQIYSIFRIIVPRYLILIEQNTNLLLKT